MKKGFTLIEIIVSISLIVILGVGSILGVRLVNKNIKINKLEQIQDKLYEAANIYIETNKESYNQLYKSKNGVVIPLSVLKNEGLIDLSLTELDDSDIENEYIVAALGNTYPNGECIDASLVNSWDNGDKTIYLCANSDGTSNLQSVGGSANNLSRATRERYYYIKDKYVEPHNYVKFGNNLYRIFYIDIDDSLVLLSKTSFGSIFNGVTQYVTDRQPFNWVSLDEFKNICYDSLNSDWIAAGEGHIDCCDLIYAYAEELDNDITLYPSKGLNFTGWLYNYSNISLKYSDYSGSKMKCESNGSTKSYKIHLKPCMKITTGAGSKVNPFILENKC